MLLASYVRKQSHTLALLIRLRWDHLDVGSWGAIDVDRFGESYQITRSNGVGSL